MRRLPSPSRWSPAARMRPGGSAVFFCSNSASCAARALWFPTYAFPLITCPSRLFGRWVAQLAWTAEPVPDRRTRKPSSFHRQLIRHGSPLGRRDPGSRSAVLVMVHLPAASTTPYARTVSGPSPRRPHPVLPTIGKVSVPASKGGRLRPERRSRSCRPGSRASLSGNQSFM